METNEMNKEAFNDDQLDEVTGGVTGGVQGVKPDILPVGAVKPDIQLVGSKKSGKPGIAPVGGGNSNMKQWM